MASFLLFTSANSLADGWILMAPEFTITDVEILPTKKWVILDSFATILQCNERRSSLIRQIDKERREIKGYGRSRRTDRNRPGTQTAVVHVHHL
jgi:hypothetical protein